MSNKKQIRILMEIRKQLTELPAHDMNIGAAIFCVDRALQHLREMNRALQNLRENEIQTRNRESSSHTSSKTK